MDTLRENQSLLRPTPEGDAAGKANSNGHNHHAVVHTWETPSGFSGDTENTPLDGLADEAAGPDRFARGYTDPLFPCKPVPGPYAFIKRILDIVVSIVALIIASPILLITALAVKLTSRGPIIFKQVRVGRGGRYFKCYKFRSMCADAEAQREKLQHLNEASGPVFKIKSDPRITPVGAFIRKYSIDELPQFFNVLKGDMTLVGPRPPIPSEVATYGPHERKRLAVTPGLTCLWQIGGRSNVSFDRWVELDLLYIENMSFLNDLKILVKTIPAVLTGSGAH